jgi:hypothetical protein
VLKIHIFPIHITIICFLYSLFSFEVFPDWAFGLVPDADGWLEATPVWAAPLLFGPKSHFCLGFVLLVYAPI